MADEPMRVPVKLALLKMREEIMNLHSDLLDIETCIMKGDSVHDSDEAGDDRYRTLQKMDYVLQSLVGLDVFLMNVCSLEQCFGDIPENEATKGVSMESLALRLSGRLCVKASQGQSGQRGVELF